MNYYSYYKEGACLLVFMLATLGWFFLIHPVYEDLLKLQRAERELIKEYSDIESYVSSRRNDMTGSMRIIQPLSLSAMTMSFLHWLDWYNHTTSSLKISASDHLPESKIVHSATEGDISSLLMLFSDMGHTKNPGILTDFVFEPLHEQWRLTADTFMSKDVIHLQEHNTVLRSSSMWCDVKRETWNHQGETLLPFISIQQLRMIGALQINQQYYALLQLPNNTVVSVEVGMVLGKEQASVELIKQNYLSFVFSSQKHMKLFLI